MSESNENPSPKIVIRPDGAYKVYGNIPLVHKTQVVSEYGEPLTWKKDGEYPQKSEYSLCRCGKSKEMPYCDGAHNEFEFDGTETADTRPQTERQQILEGGVGIVIKKDEYLCMNSGFCGNRLTNIDEMMSRTSEPSVRAEIIAMIERCPSAAYTYSMKADEPDIEPDLPLQIADTTEVTEFGPIQGPLWVTGNIPIERSDGQPFETHNRVTLCNCGESCKKPYCDGTHRAIQEEQLRKNQK